MPPCPTGLWVLSSECLIAWQWWGPNCQGDDESPPCPYTPLCVTFALLLGSPPCIPCTSLRGDVVEPTLSSASLQPKQGCPQRPLWAGWPLSLVSSHKHKAPGCIAFQTSAVLEKVQRSGMNFPDWRQQRYHLVSQWVTETQERQFRREIRRSN